MPTTPKLIHTASNCTLAGIGRCDRLHVGSLVMVVVGPQLGFGQAGVVREVSPTGAVTVRFAQAVAGTDTVDELNYDESELEVMV